MFSGIRHAQKKSDNNAIAFRRCWHHPKERFNAPFHPACLNCRGERAELMRKMAAALQRLTRWPTSVAAFLKLLLTNLILVHASQNDFNDKKIKLLAAKKWHRPTMWNSLKFPLFLTLLYHAWDKFALWYAQLGGHFITNVNGRANYDAELLRDAAGGFAATAVLGGQQTAKLAFKIIQYKCVKLNFGHKFRRRWWMHKSFHVRMVRCS